MRIDEKYIRDFVSKHDYDIRKTHNARFTDQKCIPDVVCAVAECTLDYVGDDLETTFSKNDIWHSEYSSNLVSESFSKPNTEEETAESEFDKFFAQPLKMFASAGIIEEFKDGISNIYKVKEHEILSWISMREMNALIFLDVYFTKALTDSGYMQYFDEFFTKQDKKSFDTLRDHIIEMYHTHTPVKKDYEPKRIFNKLLNVLAFRRKKLGAKKGFISKDIISLADIRYNNVNWRDINKPKGMTRQEYALTVDGATASNEGYYNRAVNQAKRFVRELEQYSEVHRYPCYPATDAHHIFMKSEYPDLADMPENIIALTGTEHYTYAHPNRNTQRTDADYQMVCLISKLDSIERNFQAGCNDYSLAEFIRVLNEGLETDEFSEQMGYEMIKAHLLRYLRPV